MLLVLVAAGPAFAETPSRAAAARHQQVLLKDWALARCLSLGYGRVPAGEDAGRSAAARLEFGTYGIDAYEAVGALVARHLAKPPYEGSTGGTYVTLQCFDLFHSAELDRLVRRQKLGPGAQ